MQLLTYTSHVSSGHRTEPHGTRTLPLTARTQASAAPAPASPSRISVSPPHTEHVGGCNGIRELTRPAVLLCAHNRHVRAAVNKSRAATRTSDKTHSEDPESSHLKTGKHVTWALFTCLSLEQCALVRRQEALRCTRPVPGCVHSFPRDAALRSGAVSPAEKFCPKRKSHPPLKTKPTASSAQLATRTT